MNRLKLKPWHHCARCLRGLGYGTIRLSKSFRKSRNAVRLFVERFGHSTDRPEALGFQRKKPRNPKRVTHKFVTCALCLYELSFGWRQASRQLFGSSRFATTVEGWVKSRVPTLDNRAARSQRRLRPSPKVKPRIDFDERWKTIPYRKLNLYLSQRMSMFLRHGKNAKRMSQLVGCSQQHLRNHLESQFHSGMSFDNYGALWEIDHRIPQCAFDLRDPAQRHQCYYYPNLQPLLVSQNARKSISCPLPVFLPPSDLRLDPAKLRFPRPNHSGVVREG